MKKLLTFCAVPMIAALVLTGCGDKGDAQKAGETVDNAYQDVKTSVNKSNSLFNKDQSIHFNLESKTKKKQKNSHIYF